ncbi:hypothetical protein T492DRAFT_836335 [Pavlovales sp. CCMP2436]|nr:hypothetical protein T492DRAFT_836335 [Pavlovales sp. CCMP2436]
MAQVAAVGDMVQVGMRLALVLAAEDKRRLQVQFESDGLVAHVATRNARPLAPAKHGDGLATGAVVLARVGPDNSEWAAATVLAVVRADGIFDGTHADASAAEAGAGGAGAEAGAGGADADGAAISGGVVAVRLSVRFDDGREAWRRPSEVRASTSPAADSTAEPTADGRDQASRSCTAPGASEAGAAGGGRAGGRAFTIGGQAPLPNEGEVGAARSGKARAAPAQPSVDELDAAVRDAGASAAALAVAMQTSAPGVLGGGRGGRGGKAAAGQAGPSNAPGAGRGRLQGGRAFTIGGQSALPGEGADEGGVPSLSGGGGWAGPFATARKLLKERPAALAKRERELDAEAEKDSSLSWQPIKMRALEVGGEEGEVFMILP